MSSWIRGEHTACANFKKRPARAAEIEIQTLPEEAIDDCWPGTTKNLKQVLHERGPIGPNDLSKYSKDGKKNPSTGQN